MECVIVSSFFPAPINNLIYVCIYLLRKYMLSRNKAKLYGKGSLFL